MPLLLPKKLTTTGTPIIGHAGALSLLPGGVAVMPSRRRIVRVNATAVAFTASGASVADCNGRYVLDGTANGWLKYRNLDATAYCWCSPDGRWLFYSEVGPGGAETYWFYSSANGQGESHPWLQEWNHAYWNGASIPVPALTT